MPVLGSSKVKLVRKADRSVSLGDDAATLMSVPWCSDLRYFVLDPMVAPSRGVGVPWTSVRCGLHAPVAWSWREVTADIPHAI